MSLNTYRIEPFAHGGPRFNELLDFIYDILYRPFDIDIEGPWRHVEEGSLHFVAFDESDRIIGCARMAPSDGTSARQVRTVAVANERQGSGLGRELMFAIEKAAIAEGATELWLNARVPAVGFYERLGYAVESEAFINPPSGLPHKRMRKLLSV